MEWLHSQSQKMQIQLEPRRTRSGINYDVYTSNEDTYTSDEDHDTSDEDANTSDEDTDMSDEIIEIDSVSDEAGLHIDLTSEDTDEDDFQASDEPTPSGHSTDTDTISESWLEEWPEQCPARADLMVSHNEQH